MLVLSRKVGESIDIGNGISILVTEIKGNKVRLGIEAPKDVRIVRRELDATESPAAKAKAIPFAQRQKTEQRPSSTQAKPVVPPLASFFPINTFASA